jgi:hypothetical protein
MKPYIPMLWTSYSVDDKVDFLIECGCTEPIAKEYALREYDSLPHKLRSKIEALENFD